MYKPKSSLQYYVRVNTDEDLETVRTKLNNSEYDRFKSVISRNNEFLFTCFKPLNCKYGMKSFSNLLGVSGMVELVSSYGLPDKFIKGLSLSDFDENRVNAWGDLTLHAIKCKVEKYANHEVQVNVRRNEIDAIREKGVDAAVEKGLISVHSRRAYREYEDDQKEAEKTIKYEDKELPDGARLVFTTLKGKELLINVYKLPSSEDNHDKVELTDSKKGRLLPVNTHVRKRKHYYFYSAPGYGKSVLLNALEHRTNASSVKNWKNMVGVRENAQFLLHDEYSHTSGLTLSELKSLTGGSACFGGNKKTFGKNLEPRKDVQLVMASNVHLFEGVGSTYNQRSQKREMSWTTAEQLLHRFIIFKLDDENFNDLVVGASHISIQSDHYIDFVEDWNDVNKFALNNQKLCELYVKYLNLEYVKHVIPKKQREDFEGDEERYVRHYEEKFRNSTNAYNIFVDRFDIDAIVMNEDQCTFKILSKNALFRRMNNLMRYHDWYEKLKKNGEQHQDQTIVNPLKRKRNDEDDEYIQKRLVIDEDPCANDDEQIDM